MMTGNQVHAMKQLEQVTCIFCSGLESMVVAGTGTHALLQLDMANWTA